MNTNVVIQAIPANTKTMKTDILKNPSNGINDL